jgi:CRISPR-associated protein Csm3
MDEYQLMGKVLFQGKINVITGLVIGGSISSLDIGGIDNPVIKDSQGFPYIPGSTLKGKMRSLLEQAYYPLRNDDDSSDQKGFFDPRMVIHKFNDGKVDDIIKIFGLSDNGEPGRGIFRDAKFDIEHFVKMENDLFSNLELDYTEDKIENSVDRISARATPRHLERVPPGVRFDFEIILNLYSSKDKDLLKLIFQGLKLLEDDYLGGSGTRGSGKIIFEQIIIKFRDIDYYLTKENEQNLTEESTNLKDIDSEEWISDVISKINF